MYIFIQDWPRISKNFAVIPKIIQFDFKMFFFSSYKYHFGIISGQFYCLVSWRSKIRTPGCYKCGMKSHIYSHLTLLHTYTDA